LAIWGAPLIILFLLVSVLFKTQGLSLALNLNYKATTEDYLDANSLQHNEMILKKQHIKITSKQKKCLKQLATLWSS
jgi:hypothetical protein